MKIEKKTANSAGDLALAYIKYLKAAPALNSRRIFEAWDSVSGASQYTLNRFFKNGTLFIKLNSSVARNYLQFQTESIKERMNAVLAEDELFIKDDPKVGYVENIVLK